MTGEAEAGAPSRAPSLLGELHPRRFFLETWQRMDAEASALRDAREKEGGRYDAWPFVALVTGAVCLTAMEYLGNSDAYFALLRWLKEHGQRDVVERLRGSDYATLFEFVWWSGWRVLGYFLVPALTVKLAKERLRDHGLETRGFLEHAWIYALAYLVVLGCVIAVSFTEEFSSYYPFYKLASRSWFDFAAWEVLYAAQFFSLEFFFRGYWLRACKRAMGSHAIFAMVVPYCMIHFGKPGMEALGAIIAGVVLGTLAMKTRSIWSGFLIHVSVAISMDVAALLQTTGLPE